MAFKMKGGSPFQRNFKTGPSPLHQEVVTPSSEHYPMEGPSDFSDVKQDESTGQLFIIAEGKRFNLPDGFSDYKGEIGVGDRVDETALEELFKMDEEEEEIEGPPEKTIPEGEIPLRPV